MLALALACVSPVACDDDDPTPGRDGGGGSGGDAGVRDGGDAGGRDGDALGDAVDVAAEAGGGDAGMIGVNRPVKRPYSAALLGQLQVPAGFRVTAYTTGLTNPRMLAMGPDGSAYVTSRSAGQVIRLRDRNGDGDANDDGERETVASKTDTPDLDGAHGLLIHQGMMYVATVKYVLAATLADGVPAGWTRLISDLPDGGQHPNRTLAVGPDGNLYVTVGSSCNACGETNPEHATVLRVNLAGAMVPNATNAQHPMLARDPTARMSMRVFASGLRNTLGFDWHPVTSELWGSDHGSDGLGNDVPNDELNRLVEGKSYGWPYCWGNRQVDPVMDQPSEMTSKQAYCPTTEPMVLGYQAHSAPIGFLFYRGDQFPADYKGDAFVAFRGSWNRDQPVGYKVVRVHFVNGAPAPLAGQTQAYSDFLSGFLIEGGQAHFGRLAGLAVDATGALLVAEDDNGVIYRVSYGSGGVGDGGTDGGAVDGGDASVADAAGDSAGN